MTAHATPRLILSMPYNGELVVPFHLRAVLEQVDEVILTESAITHSGHRKTRFFSDELPADPKLTILRIEEFPAITQEWVDRHAARYLGPDENWFRENYQRNYPCQYIAQRYAGERIITVFVDADEIVKPDILWQLRGNYHQLDTPVHLEMLFFYFNFRWLKKMPWMHGFAVNDHGLALASPQEMRMNADLRLLKDAGWHLAYFSSIEEQVRKLESFAHQEFNNAAYKKRNYLLECIKLGKDPLGRGEAEDMQPFDLNQENVQRLLPARFRELQDMMDRLQTST
jgi:hypothetical protein